MPIVDRVKYPVEIHPAFALQGSGLIANSDGELLAAIEAALNLSPIAELRVSRLSDAKPDPESRGTQTDIGSTVEPKEQINARTGRG